MDDSEDNDDRNKDNEQTDGTNTKRNINAYSTIQQTNDDINHCLEQVKEKGIITMRDQRQKWMKRLEKHELCM